MNNHTSPLTRFAAVLFALLFAAGCAREAPSVDDDPWTECQSAPRQQCVLTLAQAALPSVDGDGDWVAAAVEVALAMDASGRAGDGLALLGQAQDRAAAMTDVVAKTKSLVEVANGFIALGDSAKVHTVVTLGEDSVRDIEDENTRWDLTGKLAAARAGIGDYKTALSVARSMPASSYTLAAHKARTLNEIAVHQAANGDFDAAVQTIAGITMGLPYYQSTARSKVAGSAPPGSGDTVARLLAEAEAIARAQDDGYFIAGALRYIGTVHSGYGDTAQALEFFEDAATHANQARSAQERARATSRVATALADGKQNQSAVELISVAMDIAETEAEDLLRFWTYYEITGSAAFAGGFELASETLARIPTDTDFGGKSLQRAALRDLAWGYARHGQPQESLGVLRTMPPSREQVQALARIVRVMGEPEMAALPRYL